MRFRSKAGKISALETIFFLQGHGMVLYATIIPSGKLAGGATLDFGGPVHDYAHVSPIILRNTFRTNCFSYELLKT